MREILFRGKAVDSGKWVEGDLHHNGDTARPMTLIGQVVMSRDKQTTELSLDGFWLSEVDPATVGQYTGLTDKNGRKIFEGDIVRWTSKGGLLVSNYTYYGSYAYGSVLIVIALESGFTLRRIKDGAPDIPNANCKIDNYAFWNHSGQLEVIGNIHDNSGQFDNSEQLEV